MSGKTIVRLQVRAFASDGLARVGREALDSTAELRRKLDDWAERTSGEVREIQIALLARISESQAEGKQQLAEHKQASSLALAELGKQDALQDERIRDLAAIGMEKRGFWGILGDWWIYHRIPGAGPHPIFH